MRWSALWDVRRRSSRPRRPPRLPRRRVKPALGIKPFGTADPNFKPDYSKLPPELAKTFAYIDEHVDEHAENLRKWMQQPSISNSGEGIPESAEMVKGFFEELGCQDSRVVDTGITEYGSPGNPVVYAKCDEGAPKTLAIWWQFDTMPVTQPDNWVAPPFEARVVDGADGRGPRSLARDHRPRREQFQGARDGPVERRPIAESGDGQAAREPDLAWPKATRSAWTSACASSSRITRICCRKPTPFIHGGPSEGCVYVELTTSGKSWGRGPTISDIHGSNMRTVDSVGWRHIHMLASLTSDDGNTPLIKGFFENKEPPTPADVARMKAASAKWDLAAMAKNLGVARYKWDDPYMVMKGGSFETSFNLDGIWGGNMYAGGAGAIMPNKITSKHNFRYVPRMDGLDIVKKLRAQIDANGYKDVDVKLIGDVPWSRGSSMDTDITHARQKGAEDMTSVGLGSTPGAGYFASNSNGMKSDFEAEPTGGYWPSYLWADGEVGQKVGTISIPMGMGGGAGAGSGRGHAANEYFTLEAIAKSGGLATAEKDIAAGIFEYSEAHDHAAQAEDFRGQEVVVRPDVCH